MVVLLLLLFVMALLLYLGYPATRAGMALAVLLYWGALCLAYGHIIQPLFAYAGFELQIDAFGITASLLLLLASSLFLPKALRNPSDFFLQLWYLLAYVPLLVLFALAGADGAYILLVSLCFGLLSLSRRFLPRVGMPAIKGGKRIGLLLSIGISLFCYGVLIYASGLRLNLSFAEVYGYRSQYTESIRGVPLIGYVVDWQGYVINPTLFGLGLMRRRLGLLLLALALQILLFSITGLKSFFLAPLLIAAMLYLAHKPRKSGMTLALGSGALVGLSSLAYLLLDNVWPLSMLIRRLLLLPARIQLVYYDFFSRHAKALLSHSVLSWFFSYPYEAPPSGLIAQVMDPTKTGGANTGFLADAYANFGIGGMLAFALLLALMLHFLDGLALNRGLVGALLPVCLPLFALLNSPLLTTLMTHGLLYGLLMSSLWPVQKSPRRASSKERASLPISPSHSQAQEEPCT